MGSRNATAEDFRRSIATIESGDAAVGAWITHRSTLDAVAETFAALEGPDSGVIKAIIDV